MIRMALLAILGIATLIPGVLARADEPNSGVPLCNGPATGLDGQVNIDRSVVYPCRPLKGMPPPPMAPPSSPAPVVSPPLPFPSTGVRMDPKHPLKIGLAYYPDAAKRAHEEGRCIMLITVSAEGRITAAQLQTSSGYARLDQACLEAVANQRMLPATANGRPIEKTVSVPIVWKLP
jgi:periplasmic protein TonB